MALYLGNNKVSMSSFLEGTGGQGQDSKVEEYPQMNATAAAYLTAAEAAYTDTNGDSVSVLDSYTGPAESRMLRWAKRLRCRVERVTSRMRPPASGESLTISWEGNP